MLSATILVGIILVIGYLLFWPVGINPRPWTPPQTLPYEGRFALTDSLASAEKLWRGKVAGPEATAIRDGMLYTGLHNGDIVRCALNEVGDPVVMANTGGRPLGLKFDGHGDLIICDAEKGLVRVTLDGVVSILSDAVDGRRYNVADDLAIDRDGKIYFSDISTKYNLAAADYIMMEDNPDGVLVCYDPDSSSSAVVLDNMHLSNGVAVSADGDAVLVNETTGFCISRLWLRGPKKGQRDTFVNNLPGAPDNITFNGKDTYWVALAYPRYPRLEALASQPFLKKLMLRLPRFLAPVPEFFDGLGLATYGLLVGVDLNGNITHFMDAHRGSIGMVTSVLEHDGHLYLGSLISDYVARVPVPKPLA